MVNLKELVKKYPKRALRGEELTFDEDWERAFVGFECMALMNVSMSKQTLQYGNQLSDRIKEAFKADTPLPLDAQSQQDLKVVFRIKNIYKAKGLLIEPLSRLHDIMIKNKEFVDRQVYIYYVRADATLTAEINKCLDTIEAMDYTIVQVFKKNSPEVDLSVVEREALEGINSEATIRKIFEDIQKSIGVEL